MNKLSKYILTSLRARGAWQSGFYHQKTALASGFDVTVGGKPSNVSPPELVKVYHKFAGGEPDSLPLTYQPRNTEAKQIYHNFQAGFTSERRRLLQAGIIKLTKKLLVFYILSSLVIITLLFFVLKELNRTQVLGSLENVLTIRAEDAPTNKDLAEVNKLIDLPESSELISFGQIKDLETLKGKADFFKKAHKGDLLIISPTMTIIFDPKTKTVVDISNKELL